MLVPFVIWVAGHRSAGSSRMNGSCAYAWDRQSPMAVGVDTVGQWGGDGRQDAACHRREQRRETQSGAMAQSLFDLGNVLVHSTHFVGAHT